MNKEWMLYKTRERMKQLENMYHAACRDEDLMGNPIKPGTAAVYRSHYKKNIQLLMLIEQLLLTSQSVFIEDADCLAAFDKLIGE